MATTDAGILAETGLADDGGAAGNREGLLGMEAFPRTDSDTTPFAELSDNRTASQDAAACEPLSQPTGDCGDTPAQNAQPNAPEPVATAAAPPSEVPPPSVIAPAASSPLPPLRRLSMFEHWSSARHESRAYFNFSVGVTVSCPTDKSNEELRSCLQWRLAVLCDKRPMLRVGVAGLWTTTPYFIRIPEYRRLVFDDACVTVLDRAPTAPMSLTDPTVTGPNGLDSLCACIQEWSSKPLDTAGAAQSQALLWRAALVRSHGAAECDVVLNFHHSLVDGLGGASVLADLVAGQPFDMGSDETGDSQPAAAASRATSPTVAWDLPPAMEDVVSLKPSVGYLIKKLTLKLLVPAVLQRVIVPQDFYVGPRIIPPAEVLADRTLMAHIAVPPKMSARIASLARSHGTTVTGALCAAVGFAIAAFDARTKSVAGVSPGPKTPKGVKVAFESAVNQRNAGSVKIDVSKMGSFVVGSDTEAVVGPNTQFWALATAVRDGIMSGIVRARETMGLISFVSTPLEEFMLLQPHTQPNGRNCTVSVSNLGRCVIPDARRLLFSQSCNSIASFVSLSVASIAADGGDQMCLSLTWGSAVATADEGRQLASDLASALRLAVTRDADGLSAHEYMSIVCDDGAGGH